MRRLEDDSTNSLKHEALVAYSEDSVQGVLLRS